METKQALNQNGCIRIKNMSFTITTNKEEHTLPRIPGFLPRNDDIMYLYNEDRVTDKGKTEKLTLYSIEDKNGDLQAFYTRHENGDMECRYKGETYIISSRELDEIKKKDSGSLEAMHRFDGKIDLEPTFYPSGKTLALIGGGAVAASMLTGVGEPALLGLLGSGAISFEKLKAYFPKGNNKGTVNLNIKDRRDGR